MFKVFFFWQRSDAIKLYTYNENLRNNYLVYFNKQEKTSKDYILNEVKKYLQKHPTLFSTESPRPTRTRSEGDFQISAAFDWI